MTTPIAFSPGQLRALPPQDLAVARAEVEIIKRRYIVDDDPCSLRAAAGILEAHAGDVGSSDRLRLWAALLRQDAMAASGQSA
jgi:hypothetical protein